MSTAFDPWYQGYAQQLLQTPRTPGGGTGFVNGPDNPQPGESAMYPDSPEKLYSGMDDPALKNAIAQELTRQVSGSNSKSFSDYAPGVTPDQFFNYFRQQGSFDTQSQSSDDDWLDKAMNIAVPSFIGFAAGGAAGGALGDAGGAVGASAGEGASYNAAGNAVYDAGTAGGSGIGAGGGAGGNNPMNGSIMGNPQAAINDPLAGVDMSSIFGQSAMPPSTGPLSAESALGSGAGGSATSGGGGLLDWLSGQASNVANNPSTLAQTGIGAGANFLIQNLLSQRAQNQSQQLQQAGNPLNDSQRQPFQNQATDLVNNPQNYFQNNPFAQSLTQYYKNSVIPSQVAKSGNPTDVIDRTGSAFATALGGNYNQLLQTLQGFGGFNQGNSGIPASGALDSQSNNFANEAFRGLGNAATSAVSSVFGDPTKPNQGGSSSGIFGASKVGA